MEAVCAPALDQAIEPPQELNDSEAQTLQEPTPEPEASPNRQDQSAVEIRITLPSNHADLLKILSTLKALEAEPPAKLPDPAPAPIANIIPSPALIGEARSPAAKSRASASGAWLTPLALLGAVAIGFVLRATFDPPPAHRAPRRAEAPTRTLVDQIIGTESHGNALAKNQFSSALGLGQFVDATWLDLIRRHRPEIASSHSERDILDMRKDPELSRFMTARYVEENKTILARKGLPVTPGALYLAHFAGPGGAVAILTAPENADAAAVIANVDNRLTREKIVNGNPFIKNFTAKDLKNWADLKMQGMTLVEGDARITGQRDL
jgi:hypothetical protein